MRLNTLKPAAGAKTPPKRVARGPGSGNGKTAGRGQKGQGSRSGGGAPAGFEGGQMPLQRRLPKYGFKSRKARFVSELRIDALAGLNAESIDLALLKERGLVPRRARRVKVINSGALVEPVVLRGVAVTKGARAAIESAGGRVEGE